VLPYAVRPSILSVVGSLEHYCIVVMLRVPYAMIRWPLAALEGGKTWLVRKVRSVIWLYVLASVIWPRCQIELDVCPVLSWLCVCWVRVAVHLSLMNMIVRYLCIGVPVVGAGEMWGHFTSTLVPGPLSVIYQSPMHLIMIPVLDFVLIRSAQWEFSVHLIKYALRCPLIIGLASRSAIIW
jgi:hypothetical protein